jgi:F-type H+-transporting ATPase subunit epsilon
MPNKLGDEAAPAEAQHNENGSLLMHLQVLLPSTIFACFERVTSIILETPEGTYGLLPQRQDCVAALEPGILSFTLQGRDTQYLAVDEGVLVKKGRQVSVSVRNALAGTDLAALKELVQTEFLSLTEHEKEVRAVLARLESGFMRGFKSLRN